MKQKIVIVDSQIRNPFNNCILCSTQSDLATRYPILREFNFGCYNHAFLGITLPYIEVDLDDQSSMFDILHSIRRMAGADTYLAITNMRLKFITGYMYDIPNLAIVIMHEGDEDYVGLDAEDEIYE